MPAPLPTRPSLEHLKKSAKQLLAAHRKGDRKCCPFLRKLDRFVAHSDDEILALPLALRDTQRLVAGHYGFASWPALKRAVEAERVTTARSLEEVHRRCRCEIPPYAGAGVPLGVVAALNHSGVEIDFSEFVAASGWAFSFSYRYDDASPAFMAVRGRPGADGPPEVFAFLPEALGFGYEFALTSDAEALWGFAREHVDAGTPIMSEHLDGGLITGYQEDSAGRRLHFEGPVGTGWVGVDSLNPYAVYALVRERQPMPREEIVRLALRRAAAKASAQDWEGVPQGRAALEAYVADVGDPSKDFEKTQEWFCWAAFERLMARRCAEVWLRSLAPDGPRPRAFERAADAYGEAFRHYDAFRREVLAGEPTRSSFRERARSPERIERTLPMLRQALAAEAEGLEQLIEVTQA